jgi:hypothetical protein
MCRDRFEHAGQAEIADAELTDATSLLTVDGR